MLTPSLKQIPKPKLKAPPRLTVIQKNKVMRVMKKKFDLKHLRNGQSEVLHSVLLKQNTLALMPTGAGKSLCYQLPAVLLKGLVLVLTPLISLMKDQLDKLNELDISGGELNSSMSQKEQNQVLEKLKADELKLLFVTPERLAQSEFQKLLKKVKIALVVIDEAHCVTQWGHDFRPDYLTIGESVVELGRPPVLALTATATSETIDDIQKQLKLVDCKVIQTGVLRKNLHYEAEHFEDQISKLARLKSILQSDAVRSQMTIIYAATVKTVEKIFSELEQIGISVTKYHGKLRALERETNQNQFMSGEIRVMVATTAFGMGIDKRDIRNVIHFEFPGSLEAYYQESGRAGRDGLPSKCSLFFLKKDKCTQSFFLAGKYPKPEELQLLYRALQIANAEKLTPVEFEKGLPTIAKTKMRMMLKTLRDANVLGRGLALKKPTLTEAQLKEIGAEYEEKKEHDREMLKRMIVYAQSSMCRWKMLLEYFEQKTDWDRCGHCDNCDNREKSVSHLSTATQPGESIRALH